MKKLLPILLLTAGTAFADFDAIHSVVMDVNRDGKPDIVVATSTVLYTFQGLGGGQFDIGTRLPGSYISIDSLDARDMNGDGSGDLVVGTGRAQQVWYSGQGANLTLGNSTPMDSIVWTTQAADLNGDKVPELVVLQSDDVAVLQKESALWKPTFHVAPPVAAHCVSVGDINQDGCQDLIINLTGNAKCWLWLGQKQGKPKISTFSMGKPTSYGGLGDYNGDGKVDFACGWDRGILVADGRGDGTFAPPRVVDLGRETLYQGMLAADFDGDGKCDLATSDWKSQQVQIFFAAQGPPQFTYPTRQLTMVDVGDFDGDGKPDLLLNYNLLRELATLRNLGQGKFEPGPVLKR